MYLRDRRRLDGIVARKDFSSSNGVLIPVYDRSNDLLLLAAKSDNSIYQVGMAKNILEIWSRYQGKIERYICSMLIS